MSTSNFKVVRLRWWNKPVRLARKTKDGLEFVGWVWNKRAYLVNNLNHGWVAFLDQQTPENIDVWFCDHCGASLWGAARARITRALHDLANADRALPLSKEAMLLAALEQIQAGAKSQSAHAGMSWKQVEEICDSTITLVKVGKV